MESNFLFEKEEIALLHFYDIMDWHMFHYRLTNHRHVEQPLLDCLVFQGLVVLPERLPDCL